MLNSILTEGTKITLTTQSLLLCSLVSIVLGLIIAVCYMFCNEKYTKNYLVTLVILPILVQIVIMMVNGNLGAGVAILGAFSLVRFRSVPGNSNEIATVFFAMAIGLATGMGFLGYAAIFTLIIAVVIVILSKTKFGEKKEKFMQLKITIPENLNYAELFDDILDKYSFEHSLERVKTTNLGSLFEITYKIRLKDEKDIKALIDDIRIRNGNLTVLCNRISSENIEL